MKIALICYAVTVPDDAKELPAELCECVPEGAPVACEFLDETVGVESIRITGGMLAEAVGQVITSQDFDVDAATKADIEAQRALIDQGL